MEALIANDGSLTFFYEKERFVINRFTDQDAMLPFYENRVQIKSFSNVISWWYFSKIV